MSLWHSGLQGISQLIMPSSQSVYFNPSQLYLRRNIRFEMRAAFSLLLLSVACATKKSIWSAFSFSLPTSDYGMTQLGGITHDEKTASGIYGRWSEMVTITIMGSVGEVFDLGVNGVVQNAMM